MQRVPALGLLLACLACVFLVIGCNVTSLTSDRGDTSTFGQSVTFTATTDLAGGCASPSVNFTDNGAPLCMNVPLDGSSGTFLCPTSSLALGPHTIRAVFDGACAGGDKSITHTVVPGLSLVSSKNPSAPAESVKFTATVTPNTPTTAAGTVSFSDGSTLIPGCQNVAGVNGVYTCTTTSLITFGAHTINAVHSQSAGRAVSLVQMISAALSLTSSKNPSNPSDSVTFTATTNNGGAEGTVTFKDGANALCTNVTAVDGTYKCTTNTLTTGDHTITATFNGETPLTATLTQTVRAGATVFVSSSKDPSTTGESVTFTASLDTAGGPLAGGSGTFRDIFGGTVTVLGTVAVGSNLASITASSLATGQHVIEFIYNGDGTYPPGATGSVGQRVTAAGSSLFLSSSPNPSIVGQTITLTATLTTTGTTAPRGTVTFMDGAVFLGETGLSGGTATLTTTALGAGTHSLTATYANDPNAQSATAANTHVVGKGASTLQLTASAGTTARGQNVIFRAQVASTSGGTPTGTVRFSNGTSSLGSSTLDGSGVATFSTSSLSAGRHDITATYDGDARFNGSTGTVSHTVTTVTATVTVASSPNPSRAGEAVTITATVTSTAGTPAGAVVFRNGDAIIGTASLNAAGVATLTTTTLRIGSTNLEVDYDGGGFYPSGTGSTVHVVGKATTSIQLASAPNPSTAGAAVTFKASITANPPVAITGSVEIFDGATSVGVFAIVDTTASFTTSALTPGLHTIRVVYPGNDQLLGSEASVDHTVNGATGANPSPAPPGQSSQPNPSIGTSTITPGGAGGDDDGCSVANPGAPSSSRALFLFALAGLFVARRRRR